MKYKNLFDETLSSLNIRHVHTENFNPEQIYFQLANATGDALNSIEAQINAEYRKFKKTANCSKETDDNVNDLGESFSDGHEASFSSILSKEESESDSTESLSNLDNVEAKTLEKDDNETDCECNYSTESASDFENEVWDDSMSSQAELVNLPAYEVLKLLNSRKK